MPAITSGSCAVGFGLLFCLFNVVEGVNRWIFAQVHLEALVYLRDVFLALAAGCGFVHALSIRGSRAARVAAAVAGALLFWTLVGYHYVHSLPQALFGLKTYLPVLAGLLTTRRFFESKAARGFLWFLWIAALAGLILSAIVDLPWKGNSYFIGDTAVEGQREWSIGGVDRPAGLSRGSSEVAAQIGILSLVLMVYSKRRLTRTFIGLSGIGALILATSRGSLIGLLLGMVTLAMCLSPWLKPLRASLLPIPLLPAFIVLACMFFPSILDTINEGGGSGLLTTQSLVTRGSDVWKDAWDMQIHKGSVVLGRGIGGIGSAQKIFEMLYYNPADNLFVFIVVTFGVAGATLLIVLTMISWTRLLATPNQSALCLACFAFLFGCGLTLSSLELSFLSFITFATVLPAEERGEI